MADRHVPVRTCIGCRTREPRAQLVRYVLAASPAGSLVAVRDDGARLPGRGAWLHDDGACRDLAVRRRALRRALRAAGDVELGIAPGGDAG